MSHLVLAYPVVQNPKSNHNPSGSLTPGFFLRNPGGWDEVDMNVVYVGQTLTDQFDAPSLRNIRSMLAHLDRHYINKL